MRRCCFESAVFECVDVKKSLINRSIPRIPKLPLLIYPVAFSYIIEYSSENQEKKRRKF